MRKTSLVLLSLLLVFVLAACGKKNEQSPANSAPSSTSAASDAQSDEPAPKEEVTLKVGASPVPHAKLLEVVKPILMEKGINLEIIEFTDYVQPNTQLYEKQLDANFFQHIPYLEQFNEDKGYDLVNVAGIHIEPFGGYSKKINRSTS